jgi:hypothetical protein
MFDLRLCVGERALLSLSISGAGDRSKLQILLAFLSACPLFLCSSKAT